MTEQSERAIMELRGALEEYLDCAEWNRGRKKKDWVARRNMRNVERELYTAAKRFVVEYESNDIGGRLR